MVMREEAARPTCPGQPRTTANLNGGAAPWPFSLVCSCACSVARPSSCPRQRDNFKFPIFRGYSSSIFGSRIPYLVRE
ncbi:hypothetical protein PAHAL_4G080900 [Panicum hallii]|uniref:Uncharacterized protein n=1 Tax=Panicum hallii TaxID=206008 RepID=A0A2T8JC81_9POAL|nr:hypothetical protein PAHAL_4G080900 [Panicum hallii]